MSPPHKSSICLVLSRIHVAVLAAVLTLSIALPARADTDAGPLSAETLGHLGIEDTEFVVEVSLPIDPGQLFAGRGVRGLGEVIDVEIDEKLDEYMTLGGFQSVADLSGVVLALTLDGSWEQPLGIDWITLKEVTLIRAYGFDGSKKTGFVGSYKIGDTTVTAAGIVVRDGEDVSVQLTGIADEFSMADIGSLAGGMGLKSPFGPGLGDDQLLFHDVVTMIEIGGEWMTLSVKASTRIMNTLEADVLFSMVDGKSGEPQLILGAHVSHFSFGDVAPALEGSLVGDLVFPDAVITVAQDEIELASDDMNAAEADFYNEVFGTGDYTLNFVAGANFGAALPLSALPETILAPLGMSPEDVIVVEGAPGLSFGLGGSSSVFRPADMFLRAKLPPMAPPNSPEWFVSGELALEITGSPSIAFVGAVTIYVAGPDEVEGDELTFFTRGAIGRDGANFSLSLAGGMTTDDPWEAPFGVKWMTLNEVVAKISINATGSLGLGFSADLVIGEKDIDVAVFVAVNLYTGVPTNFIFDGASEAGVGLSDLVDLQRRIASVGRPGAPRIPLDRLPDVAVKNLHLKFAPKDDSDLGVEAGLAVSGDLLIQNEEFAGVDLSIDAGGIVADAYLDSFKAGPIAWDDASLNLALTIPEQRFAIEGGAIIVGVHRHLKVNLTAKGIIANMTDAFVDVLHEIAGVASVAAEKATQAAKVVSGAAKQARTQARQRTRKVVSVVKRRWRR